MSAIMSLMKHTSFQPLMTMHHRNTRVSHNNELHVQARDCHACLRHIRLSSHTVFVFFLQGKKVKKPT